ncbi:hypothetical protein SAMN05216548_12317 [Faunimonas pinastri]|uniref:Uncharacterized protein n=1 Tax=Faunimonas pinastri TaxID=1855383 RepID=A0A1H9PWH1_9HYPH|nr:hypothetical protein SAMN05216548_12317 [Faunimonas pinastri]
MNLHFRLRFVRKGESPLQRQERAGAGSLVCSGFHWEVSKIDEAAGTA